MSEYVDPRVNDVVQRLGAYLERFQQFEFTPEIVDCIESDVRDVYVQGLLRGVAVPRMTAVVLPRLRAIEIYRADLNEKGVRTVILNATRKYPEIRMDELVVAVRRAFPDYRPSA